VLDLSPLSPGVLIAVLAFVAAVAAFRAEKARALEKAGWTFFFLILVVGEIWMIRVDRERNEDKEEKARKLQLTSFRKIADGIEASNRANQQHFEATMNEVKGLITSAKQIATTATESLHQVTGNHQFCYIMVLRLFTPTSTGIEEKYRLVALNSGPVPIDCHVQVEDNISGRSPTGMMFDEELRELPPGKAPGKEGTPGIITDMDVLPGTYYIHLYTRNDYFKETLIVHSYESGGPPESVEILSSQGRILYSQH
jgi:hypothetical protein